MILNSLQKFFMCSKNIIALSQDLLAMASCGNVFRSAMMAAHISSSFAVVIITLCLYGLLLT